MREYPHSLLRDLASSIVTEYSDTPCVCPVVCACIEIRVSVLGIIVSFLAVHIVVGRLFVV